MLGIALKLGDVEQVFNTMRIDIPDKIKVAMWMISQFEEQEFGFNNVVYREAGL